MRLSTSFALALVASTSAASLPQQRKNPLSRVKFRSAPRSAQTTAPKYNVLAATGDTDINLSSSQDLIYIADVNVAGHDYVVQLDTGSSDLWVHTNGGLPGVTQTTQSLNLKYGTGYANGNIVTANVEFAGFTIPSQALMDATDADNPVLRLGATGILGLGFTSLSSIDSTVNGTGQSWGRSVLYNIFSQDASVPNFITFYLSRSTDSDAAVEGQFTISETEDKYSAVTNQPKIPTWPPNGPMRWNILLDGFAAHGKRFSVGTTVKGVSGGKAVVLLDSGTTFTYCPDTVVNAIYKGVTGSSFDSGLGQWTLPCDTEIDVSLIIGGQQLDLHPLDMVVKSTVDKTVCVGTFIPMSSPIAPGEFDWLIGVNVLRSFYSLYDFGDPINNEPEGVHPTVQLLQLRSAADASNDFHSVRGGTPQGGSANSSPTDGGSTVQPGQSTDGSGGTGSGSGSGSGSGNGGDSGLPGSPGGEDGGTFDNLSASVRTSIQKVVTYMPAVLGILGVNVAILVALFIAGVVWILLRRKASRRPSGLSISTSGDYKAVATNEAASMRQRSPLPETPMTPRPNDNPTSSAQEALLQQQPAPQYDSSSLPIRRGMLRPAPLDFDVRHSTAF